MRRAWIIPILTLVMSGCLFSTRTPEPPSQSNTFVWTPATTPDYLIANMVGTLQILDAPDYMRVFVSSSDSGAAGKSFAFTPSPGLDQSSRGIFTNWSVQSEGAWLAKLSSLVPANSQLTVTLSNVSTSFSSANSASYSANYVISIPTTSSSSLVPGSVMGTLQMGLILVTTDQGTSEWRILSWSDFPSTSGSNATWTDLKVKLSS